MLTNLGFNGTAEHQYLRLSKRAGHFLVDNILGEHNTANDLALRYITDWHFLEPDISTNVHVIIATDVRYNLENTSQVNNC